MGRWGDGEMGKAKLPKTLIQTHNCTVRIFFSTLPTVPHLFTHFFRLHGAC
ncbi:MAG: hypothetical protein F6K23_24710 [Okeania sp. SIO2C9]|uniref:hypothetical protein n=1 Tax=Okeania sp. SIO2C9 TaxID=2607791 RepID=UPI0013C102A4|nr:hypothetical protein [Okeania sp. SIO2C9]NEQ75954.1 hypothetical protein [Okeania sp. SIO2C9]